LKPRLDLSKESNNINLKLVWVKNLRIILSFIKILIKSKDIIPTIKGLSENLTDLTIKGKQEISGKEDKDRILEISLL